jgi:hypothetical protein
MPINEKHEIEESQLLFPVVILAAIGFVYADVIYRAAGMDNYKVGIIIE